MSSTTAPAAPGTTAADGVAVNDFSILVATVNGTGSQTANNTLIRTIMRMGVPVSGKNIFPSNIQGLPTWFSIRVSEAGWSARRRHTDVLIAMNRVTAREDVEKLPAGSCVIYDEPFQLEQLRDDLTYYPVPFGKLVKECCPNPKLWKLVTNMIYVGVAVELLQLDMGCVDAALDKAFSAKPKAAQINKDAARAGAAYAAEQFESRPAFRVEARDLTEGKILIDGNAAAAIGALAGGCNVLTWYPITPSSSLAESLGELLEQYRRDEDGVAEFTNVQAEDELAAVGMVVGAGWAGARAMTATSGPGISLMSEFIGLAYAAEIPAVIADVQRVGPSTGLPTRTMQGDILACAYNSHGDTKHPLLIPASPQESYELMAECFELADEFQTPVFFVTDLDLGMNNWMAEPFPLIEGPLRRGKIVDEAKLRELGVENWGRYKDIDGDGIAWRSLPGTELDGAAYFTRGTGHDEYARYTESSEAWVQNMDRLTRKFETLRSAVPAPVLDEAEGGSNVGVIAYGTTHWALAEARELLAEDHGFHFDYLRLKAFPFSDAVADFIQGHDVVYVIDQNRDGQMATLLRNEIRGSDAKLRSLTFYDGMPLAARTLVEALTEAHG